MKSAPTRYFLPHMVLALFVFTACKNTPEQMRFTSWQSSPTEERVIRSILDTFQSKHPELAYRYEPIPGNYSEKIQLMLGTNTAPDLFWLKGYTSPSYLSFNVLKDLNPYLEKDSEFDNEDFFPVFRDAFVKEGKCFGIAKDFNVYVFFYNKEMFAEAGITEAPKDWAQLDSIARVLTKDIDGDGKTDQYGLVLEPTHEMLMPFVFQNGGMLHDAAGNLKLTDPAFTEALEYYLHFYKEGIATIPSDMGAGWNGDVMGRRQAAMCISGAWAIPYFRDNYPDLDFGLAVLPKGKQAATLAFATAFVIADKASYPDDAWTLLSYMAGKEGMKEWTQSGIALPTRKSVALANNFYEHPIYSVFMESVEFSHLYQVDFMERWADEMSATMQAFFYRDAPIQESVQKLESKLAQYKLK